MEISPETVIFRPSLLNSLTVVGRKDVSSVVEDNERADGVCGALRSMPHWAGMQREMQVEYRPSERNGTVRRTDQD